MFNLVTIPDPDNKNVIKIEPYPTIFNQDIVDPSSAIGTELKDRIIQHDWRQNRCITNRTKTFNRLKQIHNL